MRVEREGESVSNEREWKGGEWKERGVSGEIGEV